MLFYLFLLTTENTQLNTGGFSIQLQYWGVWNLTLEQTFILPIPTLINSILVWPYPTQETGCTNYRNILLLFGVYLCVLPSCDTVFPQSLVWHKVGSLILNCRLVVFDILLRSFLRSDTQSLPQTGRLSN